jgi:hypothetical protein
MKRLAVTAQLKSESAAQALELIKRGPPFDPAATGFDRHAVYFGNDEVVFVFEAEDVEARRSGDQRSGDLRGIRRWGPLLEGTPTLARPVYHWEKTNGAGRTELDWDEGWGE